MSSKKPIITPIKPTPIKPPIKKPDKDKEKEQRRKLTVAKKLETVNFPTKSAITAGTWVAEQDTTNIRKTTARKPK